VAKTPSFGTLQPPYGGGLTNSTSVGANIFLENGEVVMFYHGGNRNGDSISEGYVAASTDNENWSIQCGGNPLIRRVHPVEVDQVADLCMVDCVGGGTFGMWTAADNQTPAFSIMGGMSSPMWKQWDGLQWQQVMPTSDVLAAMKLRSKATVTTANPSVKNLDDVLMDPGATADMAFTLPRAAAGARVRINHVGTGAGTILVGKNVSDSLGSAATLSAGQSATYECFVAGVWNLVA
jgi:hypothetical protein